MGSGSRYGEAYVTCYDACKATEYLKDALADSLDGFFFSACSANSTLWLFLPPERLKETGL